MSDTATIWVRDLGRADWAMDGLALQAGSDLETAIIISLFSDREANPDDVIPDGTRDPRGWIGDVDQPHYKVGSRMWLLDRAKQTTGTLRRANDYIAEALQWLIADRVVASSISRRNGWRPRCSLPMLWPTTTRVHSFR